MSTIDSIKTQETPLRVDFGDGKYTVMQEPGGGLRFLRHGESWPVANAEWAHVGMILAMAQDLDAAKRRIAQLEEARRVDTLTTSHYVANVAIKHLWDMLGATNQTEAVLTLQAACADVERLNFVQEAAKKSRTGVSFDWIPSVEGDRSGYRFMRHHNIGEPRSGVRDTIDVAMVAAHPNQQIEWTDDRVDKLKRLWAANLTQGEIAAEFGVTRNTIAGKISRLKMTRSPSQRKPRKDRKQYPKKPNPALAWTTRSKPPQPLPVEPKFDGRGVQLVDLTNATCRWPVGTVGAPDFCFCGVLTADLSDNRPYCGEHTRLARRA